MNSPTETDDSTKDSVEWVLSRRSNSADHVRYFAASLAFVLEFLHLWTVPTSFLFWPVHGVFFALVGGAFGVVAVSLLFGPGRWTFRFGFLVTSAVLLTWGTARVAAIVFPVWLIAVRLPLAGLDLVSMLLVVVLAVSLLRLRQYY